VSLPAPWTILFSSEPLTIQVHGSITDAAAHLRSVVHRGVVLVMGARGLVGTVSEEQVRVRFRRRWYYSPLAPLFVGQFAVVAGRPSLAGAFRYSRSSQLQVGSFFAFLLLCTVIVVPAVLLGRAEPGAGWGLLVLLFLWAAALGELYFSWWMGRGDRVEIEKRLREALSIVAASAKPPDISRSGP
jgi:hypothetical protein